MGRHSSLPIWVVAWLVISSLLCIWDATFIICRPHSFPGGKLHYIWKPYSIYIEVDQRYKDMKDTFVYATSLMNLMEVACNIGVIVLNSVGSRHTLLSAFTVSVMTWWKTVLYLLQYFEFCGGGHLQKDHDLLTSVMILWIPDGIWIVVPMIIMFALWGPLLGRESDPGSAKKVH